MARVILFGIRMTAKKRALNNASWRKTMLYSRMYRDMSFTGCHLRAKLQNLETNSLGTGRDRAMTRRKRARRPRAPDERCGFSQVRCEFVFALKALFLSRMCSLTLSIFIYLSLQRGEKCYWGCSQGSVHCYLFGYQCGSHAHHVLRIHRVFQRGVVLLRQHGGIPWTQLSGKLV